MAQSAPAVLCQGLGYMHQCDAVVDTRYLDVLAGSHYLPTYSSFMAAEALVRHHAASMA